MVLLWLLFFMFDYLTILVTELRDDDIMKRITNGKEVTLEEIKLSDKAKGT